jgi:hypothetical protein
MPHSSGVRPLHNGKAVLIALALATVLTGAGSCDVSTTPGEAQPASGAPAGTGGGGGNAAGGTTALNALAVTAAGSMSGYSRDRFTHWIAQGNGCDTRDVVLKRDGKNVKATADCKITTGAWHSPYDDKDLTDPQALDIDHMVPLAAAWRSGAAKWTDEQRKDFANDLTRPQLFAVTDNVNQQKSDKAPDQWKPPLVTFWCTYATDWIVVKHHYGLTVTQGEKTALTDMLRRC